MNILYTPRFQLLRQIRKARGQEIKAAFFGKFGTELRLLQYIVMSCTFQMNLYYILLYLELVIVHGAIVVTLLYSVLTAIIGMPLLMLVTFLSSYSKQSYITFWKCTPVLEGLGYSLVFLRLISELQNVRMSSFAMLLVLKFSTGEMAEGISKCVNNKTDCITMYPTTAWNTSRNCGLGNEHVITNIVHEFNVLGNVRLGNTHSFIVSGVTWLWILICSVLGMRYVRHFTVILQLACVTVIVLICIFCLREIPWSTILNAKLINWVESKSMFEFHFWIDLILHASSIDVLGNMIWLGSLMPSNFHPKYAAVIISPLKLLVFLLFLCMGTCLAKENLVRYKILDGRCVKFRLSDILFVLVPDVLFRTNARNILVPLWYLCLAYTTACSPIYTLVAMVDSLHQRYTFLGRYQLYVITVICALSYCCSTFLLGRYGLGLTGPWRRCVMPLWGSSLLLLVSLAIFFIYSIRAVEEDYLFMYGYTPEKFWITSWKTIPILAALCFILVGYNQYTNPLCVADIDIVILAHLLTIIALLSISIVFLCTCLKHMKSGTLNDLARPSTEWGPYDSQRKIEKAVFFPHRDIKYRCKSLRCKHNCLAKYQNSFVKLVLTHRRRMSGLELQLKVADTPTEDISSDYK